MRTKCSLLKLLDHVLPGFHRIIHTGHVVPPLRSALLVLPPDLSVGSAIGFGLEAAAGLQRIAGCATRIDQPRQLLILVRTKLL